MKIIIYYFIFGLVILLFACTPQAKLEKNVQVDRKALSDSELLDLIQKQSFNYFWEGGEPISGAARERIHVDEEYAWHNKDIVTSGGTGFGIMATLVAIERNFISRKKAFQRLEKLIDWLEQADRFHGVWAHWYTPDGKAYPFSEFDDGGDLVETSFLAQGLITARQYFKNGNRKEQVLANRMDKLWKEIEWEWFTQGEDVLYWHWSPNYDFKMDFDIRGHNECLITYVLAAASPTHAVESDVFHKGYADGGRIYSNRIYKGIPLVLDHYETNNMPAGPLFWTHYSHLGLDPRKLSSEKADFWEANRNHVLIHYNHCVNNPNGYRGYSAECWGMTSSYSMRGYAGHNPTEDMGVISPTAALSSFPYTPEESMLFLRYLYEKSQDYIGPYGPYDAFSIQSDWYVERYLAIDQLPIPGMIENYRSALLWELFMSAEEVQEALDKLGFKYKE